MKFRRAMIKHKRRRMKVHGWPQGVSHSTEIKFETWGRRTLHFSSFRPKSRETEIRESMGKWESTIHLGAASISSSREMDHRQMSRVKFGVSPFRKISRLLNKMLKSRAKTNRFCMYHILSGQVELESASNEEGHQMESRPHRPTPYLR